MTSRIFVIRTEQGAVKMKIDSSTLKALEALSKFRSQSEIEIVGELLREGLQHDLRAHYAFLQMRKDALEGK